MMTILYSKILNEAGFDCKILTHTFLGRKYQVAHLIPGSIKHENVKCRLRYFFFFFYLQIWKFRPDIVFTWNLDTLKYFLSTARRFHLCPVYKIVVRCAITPSLVVDEVRLKMKSYNLSDVVISQTNEMADELINLVGINPEKVITIYNPIDKERIEVGLSEKFEFDESYTNYVAAARIHPQKDYPTMIEAFSLVLKQQPDSRLYICGEMIDAVYGKSLKENISKLGISENVFFEGYQTNPHKYLANADAFVFSSIYEGLPNAMLEALYLGIPVATTACIPYITQVIKEGYNGYTCNVGDSEGLAAAMLKAVQIKNLPKFVDANNSENQIVKLFKNL